LPNFFKNTCVSSYSMWFTVLLVLFSLSYSAPEGVVIVNEDNFDKVVRGDLHVLIKFDVSYAWGPPVDVWKDFASQVVKNPELLVVEIHVDPDKITSNLLAKKYDVNDEDKEKLPVFLFLKKGSTTKFVRFPDEFYTTPKLIQFVVKESGLMISLKGCLKNFDVLSKYFSSLGREERKKLLESAQEMLTELKDDQLEKKRAKYYIKVMSKIMDNKRYLEREPERIKSVMENGNMNEEKTIWAKNRLNILQSFGAKIKEDKVEL